MLYRTSDKPYELTCSTNGGRTKEYGRIVILHDAVCPTRKAPSSHLHYAQSFRGTTCPNPD